MAGQYLIKGQSWTKTIYIIISMVYYIAIKTTESPMATVSKTLQSLKLNLEQFVKVTLFSGAKSTTLFFH